jgi:hypothetical protein
MINKTAEFEQQILESAAQSPKLAIMRLSLEIDRELRKILASTGVLRSYTTQSLPAAITLLDQRVRIPTDIKVTVSEFWSVRNMIVHSDQEDPNIPLRALDYGLRILRMLRSIPRPSYIVLHTDVPLYSDKDCQTLRLDVRGIILEERGPDGKVLSIHIHPSTRSYQVGESVSWEWDYDNRTGWNETWYRHPRTQKIEFAWSGSMEFTGRPIDQV